MGQAYQTCDSPSAGEPHDLILDEGLIPVTALFTDPCHRVVLAVLSLTYVRVVLRYTWVHPERRNVADYPRPIRKQVKLYKGRGRISKGRRAWWWRRQPCNGSSRRTADHRVSAATSMRLVRG